MVYVGGVAKGNGTFSGAINCAVGQANVLGQSNFSAGSTYLEAYYDDFRVSRGLARYTSGFTPPAAAFEDYWNIVLLAHFDKSYPAGTGAGPTWLDSSRYCRVLYSSSASDAVNTTVTKFGGGSCYHPGTYLLAPDAPELNFAANDFTAEGWFYPTIVAAGQAGLINKQNLVGNFGPFDVYRTGSQVAARLSTTGTSWTHTIAAAGSLTVNTWHHFALVRQGATVTLYLNGTSIGSVSVGAGVALANNTAYSLVIGGYTGSSYLGAYLDEWRVINGVAAYTGNFTPATAAFTDPPMDVVATGQLRGERIRAAQAAPIPVVNRKAPLTSYGPFRLKDATWGGTASVSGNVTVNNVAAVRRVSLMDLKSMAIIKAAWSDTNGAYSFPNIDGSRKYLVLGRDYTQTYNAVVQDNITPVEAAPAPFRPARRKLRFVAGGTGLGANYPVLVRVAEGGSTNLAALAFSGADLVAPVRYMPRARDDVADIVFTDTAGNQLDFWMDAVYGTAPDRVAFYWVKLPGDLDAGPVEIYVKYNTGVTQTKTSNGAGLFPTLFDDFNVGTLSSQWASSASIAINNSIISLQGNGSAMYVQSVATFAAGLEALGSFTQFGTMNVAGWVTSQFGFVSSTANNAAVAALENTGDLATQSRLSINAEATSSANGRFTPQIGGVLAQPSRISVGRATDGSSTVALNGNVLMARAGAGTAAAYLSIHRSATSGGAGISALDWVALRKYIPSGPPAMQQFPEEFL